MQIVIDIPEKLACEGFERPFTEEEKNVLIKAIGNGIPLPKGHGRLIDAEIKELPSAVKPATIYRKKAKRWKKKYLALKTDIEKAKAESEE